MCWEFRVECNKFHGDFSCDGQTKGASGPTNRTVSGSKPKCDVIMIMKCLCARPVAECLPIQADNPLITMALELWFLSLAMLVLGAGAGQ